MPSRYKNSTDLLIYPFYNLSFRNCIRKFPSDGYDYVTIFLIRAQNFLALLGTFSRKSVTFLTVPTTRMTRGSMFEMCSQFFAVFISSWFLNFSTVCALELHQLSFSRKSSSGNSSSGNNFLDTDCLKTTIDGEQL